MDKRKIEHEPAKQLTFRDAHHSFRGETSGREMSAVFSVGYEEFALFLISSQLFHLVHFLEYRQIVFLELISRELRLRPTSYVVLLSCRT